MYQDSLSFNIGYSALTLDFQKKRGFFLKRFNFQKRFVFLKESFLCREETIHLLNLEQSTTR